VVPACLCNASVDQSDGSEKMTVQIIAEFVKVKWYQNMIVAMIVCI